MRTDANQSELPLDAPLDIVLACLSEADAVRRCLRIALRRFGRDQQTIALMCGWKSDSCLSEAASETNARCIPTTRRERFAVATGCNLLAQYIERKEVERRLAGKLTQRDAADLAADKFCDFWGIAA
jgi:hypothetical protein